jgi:hypothetical protein
LNPSGNSIEVTIFHVTGVEEAGEKKGPGIDSGSHQARDGIDEIVVQPDVGSECLYGIPITNCNRNVCAMLSNLDALTLLF